MELIKDTLILAAYDFYKTETSYSL